MRPTKAPLPALMKTPPRLRLAMSAPWSAAQVIPASTPASEPKLLAPSTLTPMSVVREVTPARATALLLTWVATLVPCPL